MDHVSATPYKPAAHLYVLTESRLVRESLSRTLQKRADLCVVGASGFRDFDLDWIATSGCNVVLMDRLTSPQDTDMLQELLSRAPSIKVLLFGMDDNPSIFLKSVCLGVCGYLLKDASAAEILAAVRAVSRDEAACPPSLCMALIQYVARQFRSVPGGIEMDAQLKPSLTYRQLELVDLVAKGMTNKEIAANLNLSEFTVKNHISRIMKQVDANDRHHVVRMIRARGVELHS
ncbi:MAG TPA: response regulator transcription factor [Candidatus Acidoferrum sp.]|jgi:DNA-binding NarL/FixJ family response regulator